MKLYNSMSRSIEDFIPYEGNTVRLYTCGPTVYHFAHIGNLRTYIHEDILEKSLNFVGFDVKRVMNITDVGHLESDADDGEDKMLAGAKRENKTVWEVAQFYTDAFFTDCDRLNIQRPEKIAKATDYIQQYIEFIQELERKGYTYFTNGNVYFDIAKFPQYTELSKMNLEELVVANRDDVQEDVHKKNPQDFVLWFTKSKFENQAMKWDSPWGVGYPGWHIECSVISLTELGNRLDIHCGGVDHIPIHHTNEIAQTEAYTGEKWTNYWWHSEFLIDTRGKMSKSKGEFLTVSLLLEKGYDALAYRYYVLGSHYRKQLAFSFEKLDDATNAYKKLRARTTQLFNTVGGVKSIADAQGAIQTEAAKALLSGFEEALKDDLNTANAMTSLYEVLKSDISDEEKAALVTLFDQVISLDLTKAYAEPVAEVDADLAAKVEDLIAKRAAAKAEKNWALADQFRDELTAMGITIKDSKEGTSWTKA